MAIDIPRPNINAPTEAGRLEQVRSYLYQMAEQLNWALNSVETKIETSVSNTPKQTSSQPTAEEAQTNFNSIKSLIIKSADIVDEYYEKTTARNKGLYVASGDFGDFVEKTEAAFEATSKDITAKFSNIQQITSDLEYIREQLIETNAYIKSGLLYYDDVSGAAVYGIEVGQTNSIDGVDVFDKFARFTSDRLSFYDKNDIEVAYISDYKLYITNAEIGGTLYHGGYRIDSSDGLAYIWEGRR